MAVALLRETPTSPSRRQKGIPVERRIKILATGVARPPRIVRTEELDAKLGLTPGTLAKTSGVKERAWATGEKATELGRDAALAALAAAGLRPDEVDVIVCGHSVPEQPIPSNAALLQRRLGLEDSGIPCFDINSTCLSFVTALDLVSHAIQAGAWKRALVVSAEVGSVGLTWSDHEVISLFGDGAAAAILERSQEGDGSSLLASHMETYSEGADFCEIRGGGTGLYATRFSEENREDYLFHMSGPKVFKLALKKLPRFMDVLLDKARVRMEDVKLVVPHQASGSALALIQRRLNLPDEKFFNVLAENGNMIAASIPSALHAAVRAGRVQRGDVVLLCGTSAGLSIGGVVIRY
jgi:3-oxoacyl-[acyl-carrier-protein] synthase-3